MSDKWIKFNKGLLVFSMVACFFSVIILTVFFADDKRLGSDVWMVFVGGLLAVIIEHTIWGLFIEIANNIYHSHKKLHISSSKEEPAKNNEENLKVILLLFRIVHGSAKDVELQIMMFLIPVLAAVKLRNKTAKKILNRKKQYCIGYYEILLLFLY